MKYYVTSDIHGFYTPFQQALTDAGYFRDTQPHRLVVLGDLFDRGREALKLQDFILDRLSTGELILIRGNHEDLYEELVTVDHGYAYDHHVHNGTIDTALQLSGFDPELALKYPGNFAMAGRNTPYYQKILPWTRDYYETDHYIFVHGWIPCTPAGDNYSSGANSSGTYFPVKNWRDASPREWKQARWINGMDAVQTVREEKAILCGHWHASYGHAKREKKGPEFGPGADFTPYYAPGIIAVDACTAYSHTVNCIVLED